MECYAVAPLLKPSIRSSPELGKEKDDREVLEGTEVERGAAYDSTCIECVRSMYGVCT